MFFIDDVAKQVKMSNAKIIFGLAEHYPSLKNLSNICQRPIEIISIKTKKNQPMYDDSVDLNDLLNTESNIFCFYPSNGLNFCKYK